MSEDFHGTYNGYTNYACRCAACTYASTAYKREWMKEQRRLALLGKAIEAAVKESNA